MSVNVEAALSVAMLAAFIWSVRFLIPGASRTRDALAITSTVLFDVLALLMWLLIGVGMRSPGKHGWNDSAPRRTGRRTSGAIGGTVTEAKMMRLIKTLRCAAVQMFAAFVLVIAYGR